MPSHHTNSTRHERGSCEIIQEIFAMGANSFLREQEEELFQRMLLKYRRPSAVITPVDADKRVKDDQDLETLIRRTLILRKAELSIATTIAPVRKESRINATARPLTGTAGKAA